MNSIIPTIREGKPTSFKIHNLDLRGKTLLENTETTENSETRLLKEEK